MDAQQHSDSRTDSVASARGEHGVSMSCERQVPVLFGASLPLCFNVAVDIRAVELWGGSLALGVLGGAQAGHALVGALMPEYDPVQKISIVPRGQAGGLTFFAPSEERLESGLYSKSYLENQVWPLSHTRHSWTSYGPMDPPADIYCPLKGGKVFL